MGRGVSRSAAGEGGGVYQRRRRRHGRKRPRLGLALSEEDDRRGHAGRGLSRRAQHVPRVERRGRGRARHRRPGRRVRPRGLLYPCGRPFGRRFHGQILWSVPLQLRRFRLLREVLRPRLRVRPGAGPGGRDHRAAPRECGRAPLRPRPLPDGHRSSHRGHGGESRRVGRQPRARSPEVRHGRARRCGSASRDVTVRTGKPHLRSGRRSQCGEPRPSRHGEGVHPLGGPPGKTLEPISLRVARPVQRVCVLDAARPAVRGGITLRRGHRRVGGHLRGGRAGFDEADAGAHQPGHGAARRESQLGRPRW